MALKFHPGSYSNRYQMHILFLLPCSKSLPVRTQKAWTPYMNAVIQPWKVSRVITDISQRSHTSTKILKEMLGC